MKTTKSIAILAGLSVFTGVAFAQTTMSKSETTVENEYLSNVEDVIISELSSSEDYDNKLVALQYLESAIEDGRSSPEMSLALEQLSSEGVSYQARTNGRVVNNFPDIRAKACDLLSKIPTTESKNTLVKVIDTDNEPMVLTAAARSLGEIGMNDNNEVVIALAKAQTKNAVLNPTSSLAFEILVAFEKLAPVTDDKSYMLQSLTAIASNHNYVRPVRLKALDVLKNLQGSGSSARRTKAPEK